MVEGTPLLREHTPKGYRKFESSRLRQNEKPPIASGIGGFVFYASLGLLAVECLLVMRVNNLSKCGRQGCGKVMAQAFDEVQPGIGNQFGDAL